MPAPRSRSPNAAKAPRDFNAWLASFRHVAILDGVSPEVVDAALSGVAYESSVKAHDHGAAAFGGNFASFAASHISAGAVARGKALIRTYAETFRKIEERFGVPAPVLVAIGDRRRASAATTARIRLSPRSPPWPGIADAPSGFGPN